MKFEVLTLFPEIVENYLSSAMMKRAAAAEAVSFTVTNIRDYAADKHKVCDDAPFGGGPGMVMKPGPVAAAIDDARLRLQGDDPRVIYLSPQGKQWSQELAEKYAGFSSLVLLCGRYEGLDERAIQTRVDEEISVGDYVLTGGELPALIMIDSITRLLPGVLGNAESAGQDSFSHENRLLDCPHYTRPETWEGLGVPEVLLSGHHANIEKWRRQMQLMRTRERRPDLWSEIEPQLSKSDRKLLAQIDKAIESEKTD